MESSSTRRQYPRYVPTAPVTVKDIISGNELGTLVNISEGGLLLAGQEALSEDMLYQLELVFAKELNGRKSVNLAVDCLWHESSASSAQLVWSGCQIIDCTEGDMAFLMSVLPSISQPVAD